MIGRRDFLLSSLFAAAGSAADPPLKIGHRQAAMMKGPGVEVFELASRIPGLSGVELQVVMKGYSLWDRDTLLTYKRAANRWGLRVPSLAGIWPAGRSLMQTATGEECYRKSIEAAELLGSSVILVAGFRDNCPKMNDEASYGPVVELLRKMGPVAANAGVTLGLENSLGAEDNRKLIDAVNHPAVRVFWDLDNVEFYGHTGQAVKGLAVLGAGRICQVHCKNEDRLLEQTGRVDWVAACKGLKRIGYEGWYMFETRHSSAEQCVEATKEEYRFLKAQPVAQAVRPVLFFLLRKTALARHNLLVPHYTRNLPHWHPDGVSLFVTWRLFGPWAPVRHHPPVADAGRAFVTYDRALDRAVTGPTWLRNPAVAQCVVEALRYGDVQLRRYALIAFCVMPNHVHVVIEPNEAMPRITQSIKGFTARTANKILGRTGERFWQDESYDHAVRNSAEMSKIIRYIERNPVSAGFVDAPEKWLWSSAFGLAKTTQA